MGWGVLGVVALWGDQTAVVELVDSEKQGYSITRAYFYN